MAYLDEPESRWVQLFAERMLLAVVLWLSAAFHAVGGALATACWCAGWAAGRLVRALLFGWTGVREGWRDGLRHERR